MKVLTIILIAAGALALFTAMAQPLLASIQLLGLGLGLLVVANIASTRIPPKAEQQGRHQ